MFAVVDVETTGGSARDGKIIEIAIVLHDGERITGEFTSLVNPGCEIPPFIRNLTGITSEMVRDAPSFDQLSGKILEILNGKHFIAHNVSFDYNILREEFRRCGLTYRSTRACTIRLSREIFPELNSYSLGRLCKELEIPVVGRHRAFGDARATATLLEMILRKDEGQSVRRALKHGSGEINLPPFLSKENVRLLPQETGVYLFKGRSGEVLYVGKAVNIRKRVLSHFNPESGTRKKKQFFESLHSVDYFLTGSEMLASLLEGSLIRKHWPRFNDSLKVPGLLHGIFRYTDQHGYDRLVINKAGKWSAPLLTFRSRLEARSFLSRLIADEGLCPRLGGLQPGRGRCGEHGIYNCSGACEGHESHQTYNQRLSSAIQVFNQWSFNGIIREKGRNPSEVALIWCKDTVPQAYGFISQRALKAGKMEKCRFQPLYRNPELSGTVYSWLSGIQQDVLLQPANDFVPEVQSDLSRLQQTRQLVLNFA